MTNSTNDASEVFARWLPDYELRADQVAAALGRLFQEAMQLAEFDEADNTLDVTKPREFLMEQRGQFPYRILFLIYSSRFDELVEAEIINSPESQAALPEGMTVQEILAHKVSQARG